MSMNLQTTYNTFPAIGVAGQREADQAGDSVITMKNAASPSIPFGAAVVFDDSPTSDADATLPGASSDVLAGIVAFAQTYARQWTDSNGTAYGELDGTGIVEGILMNVVRRGKILVICVNGCIPGNRLYVSYSSGGTWTTGVGQCGSAADSGHTISAANQGQWLSTATAGNLAWLDVDFTNA